MTDTEHDAVAAAAEAAAKAMEPLAVMVADAALGASGVSIDAAILVAQSQAISLRRIADALEKLANPPMVVTL